MPIEKTSETSDIYVQILTELRQLSARVQNVEDKVQHAEVSSPKAATSKGSRRRAVSPSSDMVLPTLGALKQSRQIQAEVDERLRDLRSFQQEQRKYKSQRGGWGHHLV